MRGGSPFVILALPRSRSYWASKFLSYGGWTCGHDEARHVRGIDDVRSWLKQDYVGTVETVAVPFWRLISKIRPDARIAVIRRPVAEVVESLVATGIGFDRAKLEISVARADQKLDQIERRVPGVLSVNFADLAGEAACARLFEHCLPFSHNHEWWETLAPVNLQIDLMAMMRYAAMHAPQLHRAASICGQEIKSGMWRGHCVAELDGMVIGEERLDTFRRDGQKLFAEHCVAVGEAADEWMRKNHRLIDQLGATGALQIITARSNGRMFGYLMSVLGPSLESESFRVATQTLFYASPDARGLGLRLQRFSVNALHATGEHWKILQRDGVRGSGGRLGSLYRRMGSKAYGELFELDLKAA